MYPEPYIIINTVTVTVEPDNPSFGNVEGIVHSGGEVITVNLPVLQDLPDNTIMAVKVEVSEQVVLDFTSTICDALEDESFGKEIIKYAEPKGEFPEECPFVKGENFKIESYIIPQDKLPKNTQPGAFHANVTISTGDGKPEVVLLADGEIILK